MSCAGCVRSVETALNEVPGVTRASINFASGSAAVTGEAALDDLIQAVQATGYDASEQVAMPVEDQQHKINSDLVESILKSLLLLVAASLLMTNMWLGFLPGLDSRLVWFGAGCLTLMLMLFAGGHFFRGALTALRQGMVTMDTLIALGTGMAFIYSMTVVLFPEIIPPGSRHQFFEAALFVIGFVNLGRAIEIHSRADASLTIRKLYNLIPQQVTVIEDGMERTIPGDQVVEGQKVRINPGQNLPVDGQIVVGQGSLDESLLTGESEPVFRKQGDQVSAGTLNLDASIVVEAMQVGAETRLAVISRLVAEAQNSKPPVARLVDRITSVFVPAVCIIALLAAVFWWLFGPEPSLSHAFVASVSVLIVACPCALGLAVPMSIMVGLGRGAEKGILIRNSEVLQAATNLNLLVLDKTGTLTLGTPQVVAVNDLSPDQLSLVMAAEQQTTHPIATAIVEACEKLSVLPAVLDDVTQVPGSGVIATCENRPVLVGSLRFLRQRGVSDMPEIDDRGTIVGCAVDGRFQGNFLLRDKLREEAPETVRQLESLGIRIVMATGDRERVARRVADKAGIDEVHAELSPEEKLALVQDFHNQGLTVGMVGDGINDAAALSAADVSIAMGMGADIARQSADVTLRDSSLAAIPETLALSRRVLRNIHQNLFVAFAYNILLIPVAAGVFFPLLLNPVLAGLAMALSSVSLVLNTSRLKFF